MDKKHIKESEGAACEDWLNANYPYISGDADEVHRKWRDSPEYWEWAQKYNLKEIFNKYQDEYLYFNRIENKLSRTRDIHAFLILDNLTQENYPLIRAAEHDEIYFETEPEKLKNVDEKVIIDLIRCGVVYDEKYNCLKMYI